MADSTDFIAHFSILPDPRVERTKKHRLIDILFIAVCTIICGGESFTDMELFGEAKEEWLRTLLELPHGIPSPSADGRVFSLLDPAAFGACFLRWSAAVHEATQGEVIALDGKTLRHSFDAATGRSALHLVSAWASENGLALGQVKVDSKSQRDHRAAGLVEAAGRERVRGDDGCDGLPEGVGGADRGAAGRLCAVSERQPGQPA